jgi:hypothetical protein
MSVSVLHGCNLARIVAARGWGNIPVHAAVAVQTPSVAQVEVMLGEAKVSLLWAGREGRG